MQYRKFKADQIFDGRSFKDDGQVLITDANGMVIDFVKAEEAGDDIETLAGILTPGFINSHCHLELSHLKGVIPPGTGLVDFLISVVGKRGKQKERIAERIIEAEKEMFANGTVGCIDIANTANAIEIKTKSRIRWHNLIEVINFYDESLQDRLAMNREILEKHQQSLSSCALTPHAPYSVNPTCFKVLNDATAGAVISIHNQESAAENELFISGEGTFLKLYSSFGFPSSPIKATGKTSLQSYLPYFTKGQTLLLVHNTFITEDDIRFAEQHAALFDLKLVYCICANANIYIENRLPPIPMLAHYGCKIVLGNDSYSSNWQLSIAKEIETILNAFPTINLETALRWATSDAATYLGWNDIGSLKKGTTPGVVLLEMSDKKEIKTSKRII